MHSSLSGDTSVTAVLAEPMEVYEAGRTAAPMLPLSAPCLLEPPRPPEPPLPPEPPPRPQEPPQPPPGPIPDPTPPNRHRQCACRGHKNVVSASLSY